MSKTNETELGRKAYSVLNKAFWLAASDRYVSKAREFPWFFRENMHKAKQCAYMAEKSVE